MSLLCLNNLISALSQNEFPRFRDSLLTRILHNNFRCGKVSMLCTLAKNDAAETKRTLQIASLGRKIQTSYSKYQQEQASASPQTGALLMPSNYVLFCKTVSILKQAMDFDINKLKQAFDITEENLVEYNIEVPIEILRLINTKKSLNEAALFVISKLLCD